MGARSRARAPAKSKPGRARRRGGGGPSPTSPNRYVRDARRTELGRDVMPRRTSLPGCRRRGSRSRPGSTGHGAMPHEQADDRTPVGRRRVAAEWPASWIAAARRGRHLVAQVQQAPPPPGGRDTHDPDAGAVDQPGVRQQRRDGGGRAAAARGAAAPRSRSRSAATSRTTSAPVTPPSSRASIASDQWPRGTSGHRASGSGLDEGHHAAWEEPAAPRGPRRFQDGAGGCRSGTRWAARTSSRDRQRWRPRSLPRGSSRRGVERIGQRATCASLTITRSVRPEQRHRRVVVSRR